MKQQDEIEITITEVLNVFYRKRKLFVIALIVGLILGGLFSLTVLSKEYELKFSYKINPIEEVDANHLIYISRNSQRFQSFANAVNIPTSNFLIHKTKQGPNPFVIEKKSYRSNLQEQVKVYEAFELTFNIKGSPISSNEFISNFERHIFVPSFAEFIRKQKLQNFLLELKNRKEQLLKKSSSLARSIHYDKAIAKTVKNKKDTGTPNLKNLVLGTNPPTNIYLKGNKKGNLELSKYDNFPARHYLPSSTQKHILLSIIQEKNTYYNLITKDLRSITNQIELIEEATQTNSLPSNSLDNYFNFLGNDQTEEQKELKVLFSGARDHLNKNYFLITPNATFTSNFSSQIRSAFIIFFAALIFAILSIFLSDFWDNNKSKIVTK